MCCSKWRKDKTSYRLYSPPTPPPSLLDPAKVRVIVDEKLLFHVSVACIPKCQNGGICLNGNICRCPTFFSGDRCEKFSVYELLAVPKPRDTHYRTRKVQRIALSEIPNQQELDGTLRLTAISPSFASNDFSLKQEIEPPEALVVKQQPIELTSPSNNVNNEGIKRERQLVLEI